MTANNIPYHVTKATAPNHMTSAKSGHVTNDSLYHAKTDKTEPRVKSWHIESLSPSASKTAKPHTTQDVTAPPQEEEDGHISQPQKAHLGKDGAESYASVVTECSFSGNDKKLVEKVKVSLKKMRPPAYQDVMKKQGAYNLVV